MDQNRLKQLLTKYLNGESLTEEEATALHQWDDSFEDEDGLRETIPDTELTEMRKRLWSQIAGNTVKNTPFRKKKTAIIAFLRVAAAAIVIIAAGVWIWTYQSRDKRSNISLYISNEIMPGNNKATLTLADGKMINLEDEKNGLVAAQAQASVLKVKSGQIAYTNDASTTETDVFNTLTTPIGGQYSVALPDGSKVTLNAGSSLKFPVAFNGKHRRVELKGEGYFEISHNASMPFLVSVGDMEVHDLGTAFNINAYDDEPIFQTTLVEGLAEVKYKDKTVPLEPGNAAVHSGNVLEVKKVNVEQVIAWRNGLFQFESADVRQILRQLARWYNVEVVYENGAYKKQITGKALRNSTLSEMLRILELSGVHCRLEGRKIIISDL